MQCNFTKKYLEDKNISYIEKNVVESEEALNEVKDLGFSSLPVIVSNGMEAFHGFRPEKLKKMG